MGKFINDMTDSVCCPCSVLVTTTPWPCLLGCGGCRYLVMLTLWWWVVDIAMYHSHGHNQPTHQVKPLGQWRRAALTLKLVLSTQHTVCSEKEEGEVEEGKVSEASADWSDLLTRTACQSGAGMRDMNNGSLWCCEILCDVRY